jgi:hypothetical protein
MITLDSKRIFAASLVAAALVGMSATSAMAAPQTNGSDAPVYLYDAGSAELFDETDVHEFEYDVIGAPSATDIEARFVCGADAQTTRTFISPVGSERDKSTWIAYASSPFHPEHPREFMMYAMTLSGNTEGAPLSVKTKGGTYSAGIACLKDNDINFASSGLWFSTIDVTPVTGVRSTRTAQPLQLLLRRQPISPSRRRPWLRRRVCSASTSRPAQLPPSATRHWSTVFRPRPASSVSSRSRMVVWRPRRGGTSPQRLLTS